MVEKITNQSNKQKQTKYIGKYFNQKPEKQTKNNINDNESTRTTNGNVNPIDIIKKSILSQVHYYFSIENLCRDIYLRCNMDLEGWVKVEFLCSFNRMKSFDEAVVVSAIEEGSDYLELEAPEKKRLRIKSEDVRKLWILSEEIKTGFLSARASANQKRAEKSAEEEGWETVVSKQQKSGLVRKSPSHPQQLVEEATQFEFEEENSEHQDFFSKERRNFDNIKVDSGEEEEEFGSSDYSEDEEVNYTGEDDVEDLTIDDQEELMKKLIIVTQSPFRKNKLNSRKYISNEIASLINDGLYFYEQDLKRKKHIFKPQSNDYSTVIVDNKRSRDAVSPVAATPLVSTTTPTPIIPSKKTTTTSSKEPTMAQMLKAHHLGEPIVEDASKAPTRLYSPKPKSSKKSKGGKNKNTPIGWVVSSSDSNQPSPSTTPRESVLPTPTTSNSSSSGAPHKVGSVEEGLPYFQHPSYELLEENGFVQHKYDKYKNKCLKERKRLGIGKSSEMNTLFRFWSHFLRTHFIQKIYQEFIDIALEDYQQGAGYGMECVFRFYSYGLEAKFRVELFNDFQTHTLLDYKTNSLYGLEKFWAFLKYRKDQTPIELFPELKEILSNFKHINDFRKHNNSNQNSSSKKPSSSSSSYHSKSSIPSMKSKSSSSSSSNSHSSNKMMNNNRNGFM